MPDFKKVVQERLASLRMDGAAESNLADEFAQHLADRYRELLAGGMPEPTAYREVLSEMDNLYPLRTAVSPARPQAVPLGDPAGNHFAGDLWRDLRYSVRSMRKNPLFVAFVVLTLALGIGANTAVFIIINTFILNPLPVPNASRLAAVSAAQVKNVSKSNVALPMSYPDYKDYQARNQVFDAMAAYTGPQVLTLQSASGSERMFDEIVSGNYFATLGLKPAKGRFFLPEEDGLPGAHAVAVMNYATWQTRFGGADNIVGKTLRINNLAFTIIGVAPPRFIGLNAVFGPDLWIPAAMAEQLQPGQMQHALSDRSKAAFLAAGRLKPGVGLAGAGANLATIAAALAREYPETDEAHAALVRPIVEVIFGNDSSSTGRTPIVFGSAVLMMVVGIVLLIACSNVANLLLARSAARQGEMAVRLAMGASRGRLVRQLLTESVMLGALAGLAGLGIGLAGLKLLWTFLPADVAANMAAPKLDPIVFVFALAISLLTGFVFGTAPALRASRTTVAESLKTEARTTGRSRSRVSLANSLLVGQVAFSFISLMTAALFLRSIERAYQIDPGFQTQHLAVLLTQPGQAGLGQPQAKAFYKQVRERISALPGVESASWATNLPLWSQVMNGLEVEGRQPRSKADTITTALNTVDLDFFKTTGIPILHGRDFSNLDRDDTTPVAIVNEKLAHDYWPGQDALGKHVRVPGEKVLRQVVGIARNANYTALAEPPQPCVYVPLEQRFSDAMVLYVRTKRDPNEILMPAQREVRAAAPQLQVNDVRTGRKIVDQALFGAKMGMALLSVFGLLALGLASIGLYGIMAFSVNLRRREIGVRIALGAASASVLRLVLKEGMSLVLTGIAIGVVAALAITRLLTRMLFGVSAADPLSLASAAVVLLLVAVMACYLPARAASRLDPLVTLREG